MTSHSQRDLSMENKILIVDDEQDILDICRQILEPSGYTVLTADSGEKALNILMDSPIDIAFVDIRMPCMDGIELLKKMKQSYSSTEVIMITADTNLDMAIESLKFGASDYMLKPFIVTEVLTRVSKTLDCLKTKRNERIYREITSLYQIYNDIGRTQSKNDLLKLILECAAKALNAATGSVLLYVPDKKNLKIMATLEPKKIEIGSEIKMGERVAGWVAKEKQPILIQEGFKNTPQFEELKVRDEIASSMVAPLVRYEKLLGVISLNRMKNSEESKFTSDDLEAFQVFVDHASLILAVQLAETGDIF